MVKERRLLIKSIARKGRLEKVEEEVKRIVERLSQGGVGGRLMVEVRELEEAMATE